MDYWKNKVFELLKFDTLKIQNLEKYVLSVLENNKLTNLTGFNEKNIWNEGIYQSILLLNSILKNKKNIKFLDIGSGAGFPSIPYLLFTDNKINLTIVDSSKKRISFLKNICQEMNLKINLVNLRVEEWKEYEKFDYITARAVTSLKNLVEISSHLGKINSTYFFLKSKRYLEELKEAQKIINILDIKKINIKKFDINDNKDHVIISYIKTKKTPEGYPRKWSIINK